MSDLNQAIVGLTPFLRVKPELQLICHFGEQWTADHDHEETGWAPFHIITQGACLIEIGGIEHQLQAGDVVVIPHGSPHTLHATAGHSDAPFRLERTLESGVIIRTNLDANKGIDDADTRLICGRLRFEQVRNNMVLAALPAIVIIGAREGGDAIRLHRLVGDIMDELQADRLGAGAIAINLASALMTIVLRTHFESLQTATGILALLTNPQTGRAVTAMLDDMMRPWTLDELAAEANTSRATLVRLFRKAAGTTPLTFLNDLRLDLAQRRIQSDGASLATIAADAGYQSQSAFHRAYQRRFGVAPGAHRQEK